LNAFLPQRTPVIADALSAAYAGRVNVAAAKMLKNRAWPFVSYLPLVRFFLVGPDTAMASLAA
jgi:hypothetical protein